MGEKQEKTAVQKMRDLYFGIKNNRTPSKKLTDLMKDHKKKTSSEEADKNKKVARPFTPEAGA
jgi:hypothetical protein